MIVNSHGQLRPGGKQHNEEENTSVVFTVNRAIAFSMPRGPLSIYFQNSTEYIHPSTDYQSPVLTHTSLVF